MHVTIRTPPPRWLSGRACASHAEDQGSIPDRARPNSKVVTAQLPNARQYVKFAVLHR